MNLYRRIIRPLLCRGGVRVAIWCEKLGSRTFVMLFASVVVGVLTGFGAWCLKFLIQSVSAYTVVYAVPGHYSWVFAIAPAGALILVGAMQRHLCHRSINRGTEKIKGLLKKHDYVLPHQLAYQPVFACALTVGLGGSAGSEGPIAYSGGAIGSGVARMCRLPASMTRAMMVCGAAAGIAAIFKAPLGGFFFALEVIGVSLSAITLIALATCCMTASATACAFSGSLYDLSVAGAMPAFDWCHLPVILLLGGALGLYSLWYRACASATRRCLDRISLPWLRNTVAGVLLGVFVIFLPLLYGEGYGVVGQILSGTTSGLTRYTLFGGMAAPWILPVFLAAILLVKGVAVTLTNCGGGVAGSYAPTLFAGCMAGLLASYATDAMGLGIPHSQIAYLAMAGAMAAIIRAPFMATFITMEITGSYGSLFPLAVVAFTAWGVAKMLRPVGDVDVRTVSDTRLPKKISAG